MAGFKNGFIKLESPRDVFYPGQVVFGSVVIELDQPLAVSGNEAVLRINFLGEAVVEWKETESEEYNGVKRYKEISYMGREEYFNVTQILAGGNAPLNLSTGSHNYKFSYQIPPGVPSTFKGDRGNISYNIEATLELTGHVVLKEVMEKSIEVVAPFDLNLGSPELKEPIDMEFEEVYNCGCFCSSEPVTIRVRLPAAGWCPGQVIPVALEVHNQSSVEISKMMFQILTREKYRSLRPVSEYVPPERVLSTVKKGSVMSGSKRNFTVDVVLPDLVAPNLENCGIINVGYFFKIIIKLSGCNDDLEDEAEICLGLIPLNETIHGEYFHPLAEFLPLGPIPDIPATNPEEEHRHAEAHQQSAYPNGPPFPNSQPGYPLFPNPAGYPTGPPQFPPKAEQGSYFMQVQEQHYSSTDPSKNYNIGFTMTSPPGAQAPGMNFFQGQSWGMPPHHTDLKIHLPPVGVNVNTPTAPPPSS